jgi:hypothetical protein
MNGLLILIFLVKAKNKNFIIKSIDIKFNKRLKGMSKTSQFSGTKRGVLKEALKLKFRDT